MKRLAFAVMVCGGIAALGAELRPPAVPLVACDPYFSIWSPADRLTDADTTHWTGRPHRLTSLVRIDGHARRVLGAGPKDVPALLQTGTTVLPTRTICTFEGAGIALTVTFMNAALPEDIDLLSRPVTYVTYEFRAIDGKPHEAAIYFEASPEIAVEDPAQTVEWSREKFGNVSALKIGTKDQPVLQKKGDHLRIDWGHFYLAAPETAKMLIMPEAASRTAFATGGEYPMFKLQMPAPAGGAPAMSTVIEPIRVTAKASSRWLMLAYDDLYSIQYFKRNLRPYWRRHGAEAADLLTSAAKDYASLCRRCAAFDEELMRDLAKVGGGSYAKIAALAFRQTWAGCKIAADANGRPLIFPKENDSNGCIGTVDVLYPMAPQFLLFGPTLTKAMLVQNLDYASSPRWKFPFAPHDLGTYPKANGQVYGGGERTEDRQMPVEETGNMLILLAALAQMEGNADFAAKYWPVVEKWADYLKNSGFDPANQLCTDDFAGHLAHNVNLSAKAICGLASFARLCELRGDKARAAEYGRIAKDYAARWVKEADDGGHFRLAFDKPGTWSQKYNAVWDRILGFDLWPPQTWRREMDFYRTSINAYGLPLDSRKEYTKADWTLWTATLTQDRADFAPLADSVLRFVNETPDRVAFSDWYESKSAHTVHFIARPVIGGVFLPALYDRALWNKWARRDRAKASGWAPLPIEPHTVSVVPTAREASNIVWRFTTQKPAGDWFRADFDTGTWNEGPAGFGKGSTPGAIVRTEWKSSDIWMRREFTRPDANGKPLYLLMHHDEDAEVYINGVPACTVVGYIDEYDIFPIDAAALATLKPGANLLAVHCHQTAGGQYIDVGIATADKAP